MVNPGDVVAVDFPGTLEIKRRPAVVVSTLAYQATRPDVVLGLLTAQTGAATGPTGLYVTGLVPRRPAQTFRISDLV